MNVDFRAAQATHRVAQRSINSDIQPDSVMDAQ